MKLPGILSLCWIFLLCLILDLDRAMAQRTEEQAANAYIEVLQNLQAARIKIVQEAVLLMQTDQQLRAKIMQEEIHASKNALQARNEPDFTWGVTRFDSSSGRSSSSQSNRSSSRRSSDSKAEYAYVPVDNSRYRYDLAETATLLKMQSLLDQNALKQVNATFLAHMKGLNANLMLYCNMADIYGLLSKTESERAAEYLERNLQEDPNNVGAMLVRATVLRNLGDLETAKLLAGDVQRFPTLAAPLGVAVAAQCQILENHYSEAHRMLDASIRFTKAQPVESLLIVRATLSSIEGDEKNAIEDVRKFASRNKHSAYALAFQALLECQSDKSIFHQIAPEHAEQAIELSRDRLPYLLEIAALARSKMGDFDRAEELMSEAIEKSSESRRVRLEPSLAMIKMKTDPKFDWTTHAKATWAAFQ